MAEHPPERPDQEEAAVPAPPPRRRRRSLIRRLLRALVLAAGLLVGTLLLALLATQTEWFQDWLRRYIVRQATQALDAELEIGRLRGNLFYGVALDEVRLVKAGEPVVAFDLIRAEYSVFDFLARRILIDELVLGRPVIVARRTADGWNVARLARRRDGGGGAPAVTIRSLRIYDGDVTVHREEGQPFRLEDLDLSMSLETGRAGTRTEIAHLSFAAQRPDLRVGRLAGRFAYQDGVLQIQGMALNLPRSDLRVDGQVRDLGREARLDLRVSSAGLAFAELGPLLPAISEIDVRPSFEATVAGPLGQLDTTFRFASAGGGARGRVLLDMSGPERGFRGELDLTQVDPAVWTRAPVVEGRVTGRARFDITLPGGGRPIRGTFALSRATGRVSGYEFADMDTRGRFDGASVRLDAARGRAYGADVSASGTIAFRRGRDRAVEYALEGRIVDFDLRNAPKTLPAPPFASRVTGRYEISGRGRALDARIRMEPSEIEGARFEAGTTGFVSIGGPRLVYGGEGRVSGLNLPRYGRVLELDALTDPRLDGTLSGDFRVQAAGRGAHELDLNAVVRLEESSLGGATLPAMMVAARLAEGRMAADLDGTFRQLDLAAMLRREPLASSLSGRLKGRLAFEDVTNPLAFAGLSFSGRLELDGAMFAGHEVTAGLFVGEIDGEFVRAQELALSGPDGRLTASGTLALDEARASDLTYRLDGVDLSKLDDLVMRDLSGTLETSGRVSGNGTELVASGAAHVADLRIASALAAPDAAAEYVVRLPELDPARLRVEANPVVTDAAMAGQVIERVAGRVAYESRTVSFDLGAEDRQRVLQTSGEVAFEPDRQRIALDRLSLAANGQEWTLAAGSAPVIVHDGAAVEVRDLVLTSGGGQRLAARGSVGVAEGAVSALDVVVSGIRVEDVERLLGTAEPRVAGALSGTARLTGTRANPFVAAQFTVADAAFRELKISETGGTVRFDGRELALDIVVYQGPGATLSAQGTVPVSLFTTKGEDGSAPIDLRVRSSTIDLALVTGLTRAVTNVEGTARIDLRVTGTAATPLYDGTLDLQGGAFTVPAAGRRYTDLATNLLFEPGRLRIASLRILDDNGDPLELTGLVGLRRLALGEMALRLDATQFGIIRNDLGTVDVDASLTVLGSLGSPRIEGKATLHSARIEVDNVLTRITGGTYPTDPLDDRLPIAGEGQRPEARELDVSVPPPPPGTPVVPDRRQEAAAKAKAPAAPGDGLAIDIRVNAPDNLILRGRDVRTSATSLGLGNVNITVGGDFRVRKEPRTPVALVGAVNTVRGSYEYRGRRFEILRDGRIQFQGTQPIDPVLDVTARRVIEPSGVEARIRLQGTARDPSISFESDPPLPESEIIALIVFNRDLNSLGDEQRTSLATLAGTAAAGFVVSPLTETLGRALNLDELEVQTTSEGAAAGGIVTIGDQVGERVFVRLRQQFGAQQVSEFLVEYRLASFLRLQAAVAEGEGVGRANRSLTRRIERAGVDLVFYFSY